MQSLQKVMMAFVFLFLGFANVAQAVVTDGWERPKVRVRLDILEAQKDLSNIKRAELVMTQQDGASSPTGFVLLIDDQSIVFEISKAKVDRCGMKTYLASPVSGAVPETARAFRLVVVDRAHSECSLRTLPIQQHVEALLTDRGEILLRMAGEPESVLTPQ